MSTVGGTTCYVDGRRKLCLIFQPEAPQRQDQKKRTEIAIKLRSRVMRFRSHNFIDSIEFRKAFDAIDKFEKGEPQ